MTTMVQYQPDQETAYGILYHEKTVSADLRLLCLWSAFGLILTGLFFALGFGADIGLALMMAG